MNTLSIILQAAPAGAGQGSMWSTIMMFALIILVMWLFMIRPQRKQQKEMEKFRNELKKGDKVITAGGIYGTISEVQDKTVLLKIDGDVKIRIEKTSLVRDSSDVQSAAPAQGEKK